MYKMMSRGKTPGKGRWIEGYYVGKTPFSPQGALIATWNFNPEDEKNFGRLITHLVVPETVGRCSELSDKNGRAIFEGDILQSRASEIPSEWKCWKVEYIDGSFVFNRDTASRRKHKHEEDLLCADNIDLYGLYIVGNIYDTPRLLQATTGKDIGNAAQDTLLPAT